MTSRVMSRVFSAPRCTLAALVMVCGAASASAQNGAPASSPLAAVGAAVTRARALVAAGDGTAARALLDSLVSHNDAGSNSLAESLYWRAVLAERSADAERDWKRLVVDAPLSPRVPDAVLHLADLEIVRGRPDAARGYLSRITRDFAESPEQPKAMLGIARSYFEERDIAHACETVTALRAKGIPDGELRLQANEMDSRCKAAANAAANAAAVAGDSASTGSSTGAGSDVSGDRATPRRGAGSSTREKYTVQLVAYDTRSQAESVVKRLAKRGLTARVDGERKPYRIHVGRYVTRADAVAALARLKKKGHSGFVTELDR